MSDLGPSPVVVGGRLWRPYAIEFDSPDGKFGFHIFALGAEHAEMLLAELKESARVLGELHGTVSWEKGK